MRFTAVCLRDIVVLATLNLCRGGKREDGVFCGSN